MPSVPVRPGQVACVLIAVALIALAPAGIATAASVRVVACRTEYGIPPPAGRLPRTVATGVSADRAVGLRFYGNNSLLVLAPAGWHCSALVGADGSAGMSVSHGRQTVAVQAVGYTSSVGAAAACPLFADADALSPVPCHQHHPRAEILTPINGTTFAFEDPARVHGTGQPSGGALPANGVMRYSPSATRGFFFEETCVLPTGEHRLCTTLLDDGIRRAPR